MKDETHTSKEEEFVNKYSFILAPDKPESAVRKDFARDLHSLIQEAIAQERNRIRKDFEEIATFENGVSSNGWYTIYKDDVYSIIFPPHTVGI